MTTILKWRRTPIFTFAVVIVIMFITYGMSRFFVSRRFSNFHDDGSGKYQLRCRLESAPAFQQLNITWFVDFGSALFYHRAKSFNSSDVDTGVFYDDVRPLASHVVPAFLSAGFFLAQEYGSLDYGLQWAFECPYSGIRFDVFVFYPPLPADAKLAPFRWWTSSYGGLCDQKPRGVCRLQFVSIELEDAEVQNASLRMVTEEFLVEQYGKEWRTPVSYGYEESLSFLPNIIDE